MARDLTADFSLSRRSCDCGPGMVAPGSIYSVHIPSLHVDAILLRHYQAAADTKKNNTTTTTHCTYKDSSTTSNQNEHKTDEDFAIKLLFSGNPFQQTPSTVFLEMAKKILPVIKHLPLYSNHNGFLPPTSAYAYWSGHHKTEDSPPQIKNTKIYIALLERINGACELR